MLDGKYKRYSQADHRITTDQNMCLWFSGNVIGMQRIHGKHSKMSMRTVKNCWKNIMQKIQISKRIRDLERERQDRKMPKEQKKERHRRAEKYMFTLSFELFHFAI